MIKLIEILVFVLLIFFTFFMGVKYSSDIKSSSFGFFFGNEEIALPPETAPIVEQPIVQDDMEEILKDGGLLQRALLDDNKVEKALSELEKEEIEVQKMKDAEIERIKALEKHTKKSQKKR